MTAINFVDLTWTFPVAVEFGEFIFVTLRIKANIWAQLYLQGQVLTTKDVRQCIWKRKPTWMRQMQCRWSRADESQMDTTSDTTSSTAHTNQEWHC